MEAQAEPHIDHQSDIWLLERLLLLARGLRSEVSPPLHDSHCFVLEGALGDPIILMIVELLNEASSIPCVIVLGDCAPIPERNWQSVRCVITTKCRESSELALNNGGSTWFSFEHSLSSREIIDEAVGPRDFRCARVSVLYKIITQIESILSHTRHGDILVYLPGQLPRVFHLYLRLHLPLEFISPPTLKERLKHLNEQVSSSTT